MQTRDYPLIRRFSTGKRPWRRAFSRHHRILELWHYADFTVLIFSGGHYPHRTALRAVLTLLYTGRVSSESGFGMELKRDYWPPPLAHCGLPLLRPADEYVTIGEITSDPVNNFKGNRMLYTALVPTENLDTVLDAVGGLISDVRTAPPERAFKPDGSYSPQFWIDLPTGKLRFESLVNKWDNHNKLVLLPDNAFLMCYRLIPEVLKDGSTSWHDLNRPVYDVVRVTPLSRYKVVEGYTTARVTVLRDYLEDYLSLKECVAVATFFDERYSTDDSEVAALMGNLGMSVKQPGREMWFKSLDVDFANQISQVSASDTLMIPHGQPITHPVEPSLQWPDHNGFITGNGWGQFKTLERAFVKDEALLAYQDRPEFDVHPESGSVGYESRWAFSYCNRYGRNHIAFELRKLYESAPEEVIKHFHTFAVSEAVADKEVQTHGKRNVGVRAKEFVEAYLDFTKTLSDLADALGIVATQEDIGKLNRSEIDYKGWWTFKDLKPIGRIIPLTLSFTDFLSRCKDLFEIFKALQKSHLLQVLVKLGLDKNQKVGPDKQPITKFESLKLAATVCQLAHLCIDSGISLVGDSGLIIAEWDTEAKLDEFNPLFALNGLRIAAAHNVLDDKVEDALEVFGIDKATCHNGWGLALDKVYDEVIAAIGAASQLIRRSWHV